MSHPERPAKRGPGQPTKLTPETQEKILAAVRAGNYLETAAAFAGVSKKTFYQWLQRGARTRTWTIYRAFSEALAEALAVAEVADVASIAKAAKDGQWQASAWRLERKFPDRWGRRERHEVSGPGGRPIEVSRTEQAARLRLLSDEDFRTLQAIAGRLPARVIDVTTEATESEPGPRDETP